MGGSVGGITLAHIGAIWVKVGVTEVMHIELQVTVSGATPVTPFATNVNVTDCPGVSPLTIKCDGATIVPVIGGPPAMLYV